MRARMEKEQQQQIDQIEKIMNPNNRMYLTVFRIDGEFNLKQTIAQAIFKGNHHVRINSKGKYFINAFHFLIAHFAQSDQDVRNRGENRVEGNNQESQKEHLLELAIKWDCFEQATNLLEELQYVNVRFSFIYTENSYIFFSET